MTHPIARAVLCCVLLATFTASAQAGTIKKCRDESGQWHYGDDAAAACSNTKVIEMTSSGRTKKVIDAPPSASDLDEFRKKQMEAQQAKAAEAEQKKHDKTLLDTYAVEDDIIYARDRQVAQLNNSIQSGEETLKSLTAVRDRMRAAATEEKEAKGSVSKNTMANLERAEKQVEQHTENLDRKRKEVAEIRQRFEADLQRYRELKGINTPVSPAPAAAK
jgi:chromosome segregation ATPase